MSTSFYRNKNLTRPRKKQSLRQHRERIHRARLVALGMPADQVALLTGKEARQLLHHPKKVQQAHARG